MNRERVKVLLLDEVARLSAIIEEHQLNKIFDDEFEMCWIRRQYVRSIIRRLRQCPMCKWGIHNGRRSKPDHVKICRRCNGTGDIFSGGR